MNDQYIEYLLKNSNSYYINDIEFLALMDLFNRKYIGEKGQLGRIVKIDKNGTILEYFDSVFDACIDSITSKQKYTFEFLSYESKNETVYEFFGLIIKKQGNSINNDVMKLLNKIIRKNKNRYLSKNKIFNEIYNERYSHNMSFEEYAINGIRYHSFLMGEQIHNLLANQNESEYTKHNIEKCFDFEDRINNLFDKYSFNKKKVFKKISCLNDIKGLTGIYILVLPEIKGCYVGKTEKCFTTRILQHFTNPNSSFDNKYSPNDVKEIYILPLVEGMHFISIVEEDCIAMLGHEISLNALAGGESIELIKSNSYKECEHYISNNVLRFVVEDAYNYIEYIMND